MIDFVRVFINDKEKFENNLSKTNLLELRSSVNRFTGEIQEYPQEGNYKNLYVKITQNQASFEGSFHRFYNEYENLGSQNFNDFSYCEFEFVRGVLCTKFGFNPKSTKITSLEFGVNIELEENPQGIIDRKILMYDFKPPNRNQKFRGKGDYLEFEMTDYSLKVYNKSKQYRLKNRYIMRFELKISRSRYLKKLGISTLQDLNIEAFERLYTELVKNIDKLLIVDEISPPIGLKMHDRVLFQNLTNPIYWRKLRENESYNVRSRYKRNIHKMISDNNLGETKTRLLLKIEEKYFQLIDCDKLLQIAA